MRFVVAALAVCLLAGCGAERGAAPARVAPPRTEPASPRVAAAQSPAPAPAVAPAPACAEGSVEQVGWVRKEDVVVAPVTTRIEVSLSERRVTLFDRGRRVLTARAAIGSAATPTPTGRFYVNQRLIPNKPTGPFGPGAIGISAFSEVLTGWAQGGPIAIHGTNRPDLIGAAVSNGCIRIENGELRRLFDRVLAGTPVTVTA